MPNRRFHYHSTLPFLVQLVLHPFQFLGGATFTGSTTVSDLISQNYLSVGTTTRKDTLTLDGALFLASLSSVPADTSSRLYNTNNGDLYWAGNLIGGSTTGNWTTNGTDVWRVGGNVGIGSTTPGYKLSVVGSGYFDGNCYSVTIYCHHLHLHSLHHSLRSSH